MILRTSRVLVVLALTGACSASEAPQPTGNVTGDFVRVGGPYPGAAVPLSGTLRFVSGARTVSVDVGAEGTFSVHLIPGRYTVKGTSQMIDGGTHPCSSPLELAVTAGPNPTQRVVCSIR